jgi:hypothetical protein
MVAKSLKFKRHLMKKRMLYWSLCCSLFSASAQASSKDFEQEEFSLSKNYPNGAVHVCLYPKTPTALVSSRWIVEHRSDRHVNSLTVETCDVDYLAQPNVRPGVLITKVGASPDSDIAGEMGILLKELSDHRERWRYQNIYIWTPLRKDPMSTAQNCSSSDNFSPFLLFAAGDGFVEDDTPLRNIFHGEIKIPAGKVQLRAASKDVAQKLREAQSS